MDKKDQIISNLRAEIFELKKAEKEHRLVDLQINELQTHLTLLHNEKERNDKEQKHRLNQDNHVILELRKEIDLVKAQIERTTLLNQDKSNNVLKLKKMAEARANQVQLIKRDCINVQSRNRTLFDQNKSLALTAKALREEKNDIQNDIEALEEIIAKNALLLKQRQKQIREKDSQVAKLSKIIDSLNNEYLRKIACLKDKNNQKCALTDELHLKEQQKAQYLHTLQQLQQECQHWRKESQRHQRLYQTELQHTRQLMQKKEFLENQLREKEIAIDELKVRKNLEKQTHVHLVQDNQTLNNEIDKNLGLIVQLTDVNNQLQKEIQMYAEEDQNARAILDRKDKMKETLLRNRNEIKVTQSTIQHLLHIR